MLLFLPTEITCMIAKLCPLRGQASLSRCCVRLHRICNDILYRNDVQNHGSSSVFHAIAWCHNQAIALRTLAAAKEGGADFRKCRDTRNHHPLSLHRIDAALHSPIHLAARRGLDDIVSFLVSQGLPPDGVEGTRRTPLAEAITFNKESTAILLVRHGASVGFQPPGFDALCAAVRQGQAKLLKCILESRSLDVNADVGYGCTVLMLAILHRREQVIPVLISLGADAIAAMRDLCQNHQFLAVSWTLEVGAGSLRKILRIKDLLNLVVSISTQRVSPTQKNQQVEVIERLLELLQRAKYGASTESIIPTEELDSFLDALLQRMLSVDFADTAISSLLLRHGARFRVGVFLQLLEILGSSTFAKDKPRCLRRYPRFLQSFDFVYFYCLSLPPSEPDFMMKYFIEAVPAQVVRLVYDLKRQGLPLTAKGVQRMDPEAA